MATRADGVGAGQGLRSSSAGQGVRWGRIAFVLVNCALWIGLIVAGRMLF